MQEVLLNIQKCSTGCLKSPLITLDLNNLKIKSRIAKTKHILKTKGLYIFLIPNMMLEILLLEIYKLYKFSMIPKSYALLIHMSWQMEACFITKPNIVYKYWFLFYLDINPITNGHSRSFVNCFDLLFYLYLVRELL